MKFLVDKIKAEGRHLGNGILKVDSFMNHQIDPVLMSEVGNEFARQFAQYSPTKVLTAETSGIAPALATAMVLKIPVVFARKKKPITMEHMLEESAPSPTKGGVVNLMISTEYIYAGDRVLIIDDFLNTALTIDALIKLVTRSGAELIGIGAVIEKVYNKGRIVLKDVKVPIVTLAKIERIDGDDIVCSNE
jgi:xanthine phosphoribosyltransferase